jgi:hypothetical protein
MRRTFLLVAMLCLTLPGPSPAAATDSAGSKYAPRLASEFELHVGERVSLHRTKLSVRFVNVLEDSRCPSDVTCVWAGNARLRLAVSSGRSSKMLTLNSNTAAPLPADSTFAGYSVKLVELSPYPLSKRPIARGSYVVRLIVSKN